MNTKKIERFASQSKVLQEFARNIREAKERGYMPHIGGKFEGSAHASTNQVELINCPLMPQVVRDKIANSFESAAGILNQLIKLECDKPLEDDHHAIAIDALAALRKGDS